MENGILLPPRYQRGRWRNAVYVDREGRVGLGFTLEVGSPVFLSLSLDDASDVRDALQDVLDQIGLRDQPERSAGMDASRSMSKSAFPVA